MKALVLVALALFAHWLQASTAKPQSSIKEQQDYHADAPQADGTNQKPTQAQGATQQQQYDPYADKLYRRYLWANVLGVVVSVILLVIVGIQARIAANSAKSLIHAERAWIMVSIDHAPGGPKRGLGTSVEGTETIERTVIPIRLICKNDGKCPAWITEKLATLVITDAHKPLPKTPDLSLLEMIQPTPEPLSVGEISHVDHSLWSKGRQGFDDMAVIYGVVRYHDVFGKNRETYFGYRVTLSNGFERLPGYSEYNKNT